MFHLIRPKPEIKGLAIFEGHATFFLQDAISTKHMADDFYFFSYYSGLKPNFKKSEIAGIGTLKGAQVAVCGLRCTDLNNNTLKILAAHFSDNEQLKEEKNL